MVRIRVGVARQQCRALLVLLIAPILSAPTREPTMRGEKFFLEVLETESYVDNLCQNYINVTRRDLKNHLILE
jgi:hypothetical protein